MMPQMPTILQANNASDIATALRVFDESDWLPLSPRPDVSRNIFPTKDNTTWSAYGDMLEQQVANSLAPLQATPLPADTSVRFKKSEMSVFGWTPLTDDLVVIVCKACEKPIKQSNFTQHFGTLHYW